MKHWLRNLCALMLMLTVMISAVSVPRAAYASEEEFQNAVSKLRTLGILDAQTAGELKAGDPMTRAAFIALCVQSMGMENAAASHSGKTAFSDVPDIHPYAGYLQTAYTMGLVSGDGERVYPDDKIKNGEAMKILVTMTGHHILLSGESGNLARFASRASSLGITRGVENTGLQAAATSADLLTMLYNTLDVDLFFPDALGTQSTYNTVEGRSILTEYLHMEKRRGVLTGTGTTRYNGPASVSDEYVEIDGEVYDAGAYTTAADSLLGCDVTFYVDLSAGGEPLPILLLEETPGKNKRLLVAADDIEESTTARELVYYANGGSKERTARIPETANVIYNGVYAGKAHMLDDEAFRPVSGSVELVDHGSGGFDLVRITKYDTYVVESVNAQQEMIADHYDRPLLDLSDKERLTIEKKGKQIEMSEIAQWDVLSVVQSLDGSKVSILVSSARVSGEVAQSREESIVIDGETYRFAQSYLTMIGGANSGEKAINAGDSATFYLDVNGEIAAVNTGGKSGNNYAYLVATSLSDSVDRTLMLRLFTKAGQLTEFTVRQRVKLDGITMKDPAAVKTVLDKLEDTYVCDTRTHGTASINDLIAENTKKQNRLISYKLAEDGSISELDTVINNPEENGRGLQIAHSNYYKRYKAYMKFSVGDGNFVFNNNTVMLNIPGDPKDERGYVAGNKFTHDQMFYVTAYEKEDGIVNVIVNFNKASGSGGSSDEIDTSVSADKTLAVIDYVAQTINDEGETVTELCMLNGGKTVEKPVVEGRKIPELRRGDIIRFDTNASGEVNAIRVLFQPWKDANMFLVDAAGGDERIYGMVYRKMPEVVEVATSLDIDPKDENSRNPYLVKRFSKIYVYDEAADRVYVGSANDIFSYETAGENASMAFMKIRYDDPKEMVVYLWKDGINHAASGGEEVQP